MPAAEQALPELDLQLLEDFAGTEMTPTQALWARIHVQASTLDPLAARYDDELRKANPRHGHSFMAASTKECWVTSLKVPARGIRSGRVFQTPPLLAAQLIVGGTHRASTPEEIEGWKAEQGIRKVKEKEQMDAKNPPAPVNHFSITPEAIQAIRGTGTAEGAAPAAAEGHHSNSKSPRQPAN